MSIQLKNCIQDEDYVQFTLFFMRNRHEFSNQFTVSDTLYHVLDTIQHSKVILIFNQSDQVVGWGHYQYASPGQEPDPQGEIVFINSVILLEEFRGSRAFFHGFRFLVNQIMEENRHVKQFQFYAQSENEYLNRLYAKFADVIGEREGLYGHENIYSVDILQLAAYLRVERVN